MKETLKEELLEFNSNKATTTKKFHPEHHLALARRSRESTKKFLLTEDILKKAKEEGRQDTL